MVEAAAAAPVVRAATELGRGLDKSESRGAPTFAAVTAAAAANFQCENCVSGR